MIKYNHIPILLIILLLGLSHGCIEPITIESENVQPELVVDGWIRTDKAQQQVTLSYTKEIDAFRLDEQIDAHVFIIDDNGNTYTLHHTEKNIFQTLENDLVPEIGRGYILNIIIGDKRILSSKEILHPVANIDSLYYEYISESRLDPSIGLERSYRYFNIYADLQDPSNAKNYYLWQNRGVVEYWTLQKEENEDGPPPLWPIRCFKCFDPITEEIYLEEDRFFNGKRIAKKQVGRIKNSRPEPIMFVLHQFSLTEDAYEYLKQLQLQIDNSGSIFDAPPGFLSGNLYNPAKNDERIYGYFKVSDVVEAKIFIPRYNFPNPNRITLEVKDCTTERGATDTMPKEYEEFLDSIGE